MDTASQSSDIDFFALWCLGSSLFLFALLDFFGGIKKLAKDSFVVKPLWTAYVFPIVSLNFFVSVLIFLYSLPFISSGFSATFEEISDVDFGNFKILLMILVILYHLLLIYQSSKKLLIIDSEGVWYQEGIFPWTKVGSGLTWKNFERAWITQGFISWVTRSYTLNVYHRYNSDIRFRIQHMPRQVVDLVNEQSEKFQ